MCDRPGATERDYNDHIRRLITTYGWAVQGVERDGIHPPWAYTVGLTPHQRPELVITGMGLARAVKVTAPWAHLNLAVEFYGRGIQGLQLVHTDKRGRWPWDDAYQGARGGQPVLGSREPPERRRRAG